MRTREQPAARAFETGVEYSETHTQAVEFEPRMDADYRGMHTVPLIKRSYTLHQLHEARRMLEKEDCK